MTGRSHLNKQVSGLALIAGGTLAAWLWALLEADAEDLMAYAVATPLAGLAVGALYHSFVIRCPRCGTRLGHLLRSPTEFSVFRFSKRVRFCPHCTIDFEDDLR